MTTRERLKEARRIVIKVGSKVLARDEQLITNLCRQIIEATDKDGREFVIVSSGAVALGCRSLGYPSRPTTVAKLQAAASAGQLELARMYAEAFAAREKPVAQVLLTHSDLASRRRLTNAQRALSALLDAGAVPFINENDAVSVDEIAFGDNDQLASMIVPLVQADVLLLLSDIPGVLDQSGARISLFTEDSEVGEAPESKGASLGSGGIGSKLSAAWKASHSGADVVVAPALEPRILSRLLQGEDLGTLFERREDSLRARQHWIAYTLRPRGDVLVNAGAVEAILEGAGSLLPVGILGVRGAFSRGDAVRLVGPNGEIARGLTRLGALEVARAAGKTSGELQTQMGELDAIVVHRSDLVQTV